MKVRVNCVIVVGGGSGIGHATAQCLLNYGVANVILASRNVDKLENAKGKLQVANGQNVYTAEMDIANVSKHESLFNHVKDITGVYADGLVISSGVNYSAANWRGFNITEKDYDRVMGTNLKGTFFLLRNFANFLYANSIKGNICVVSSISAHRDLLSVYQISKNAISGIVHAYGKHLCERGIVLNCVEPGTTDTDMMPHLKPFTDGIREGKSWNDNSIHRVIRPEEIAETICFLMNENSEILSGTCLLAGGGCKSIAR